MCRTTILTCGLIVFSLSGIGYAQDAPVPGEARGTVDGEPFSFPLNCRSWEAEQRMVFSAGDDRGSSDESGDGIVFSFSHFAPLSNTNGTLKIDGRTLGINAGFRPAADAPQWEVGDTQATFSGPTFGADVAQVDITVDCAPRSALTRGFTGRVTGVIDEQTVDEPLFCGNWDGADAIEARTEEEVGDVQAKLFVMRASDQGTVEVTTPTQSYQIVVAPIAGTTFEIADDAVSLNAELRNRQSGNEYTVDLTFTCAED